MEVDLYFPALGVVIEVDGGVHDNPTAKADDAAKTERLEALGYTVLRLH
jgi:very-short-patch-repair endonuclease